MNLMVIKYYCFRLFISIIMANQDIIINDFKVIKGIITNSKVIKDNMIIDFKVIKDIIIKVIKVTKDNFNDFQIIKGNQIIDFKIIKDIIINKVIIVNQVIIHNQFTIIDCFIINSIKYFVEFNFIMFIIDYMGDKFNLKFNEAIDNSYMDFIINL